MKIIINLLNKTILITILVSHCYASDSFFAKMDRDNQQRELERYHTSMVNEAQQQTRLLRSIHNELEEQKNTLNAQSENIRTMNNNVLHANSNIITTNDNVLNINTIMNESNKQPMQNTELYSAIRYFWSMETNEFARLRSIYQTDSTGFISYVMNKVELNKL